MTWDEVTGRIAYLAGGGAAGHATAQEWLREALCVRWGGCQHPADLPARSFAYALQRAQIALRYLENERGDIAFAVGVRAVFARAFYRSMDVRLAGPPWRLGPTEDRPTWQEWSRAADFGWRNGP